MIEIKIGVFILSAVLKLIGELWWHNAQRFILPIALGIAVSITSQCWWLGFVILPMIGPLVLGYKDYGPSNGFDRGAWLFAICLVAGLGVTLLQHLPWFFFLPYCLVGGIWGATTRNLWNVIVAPISGFIIGSVIFFIH